MNRFNSNCELDCELDYKCPTVICNNDTEFKIARDKYAQTCKLECSIGPNTPQEQKDELQSRIATLRDQASNVVLIEFDQNKVLFYKES